MKILVTPYKYSETAGGVEVFSESLQKIFPDLLMIVNSDVNLNLPTSCLFGNLLRNNDDICSLLANKRVLKITKNALVDVVFVNGVYGWYLTLKKVDVPTINIFHGCYGGVANHVLKSGKKLPFYYYKYHRGFMEYLSARGKRVVSVSQFVRDLLKQYYDIDSTVIPNGVDMKVFKAIEKYTARKVLGFPKNKKIGIFVGPLSYSKGFDIIARLAKKNPSLLFLVLSPKGDCDPNFPNIIPYTNISHLDMPNFYSVADFLILPSRFEGCNLSALEAMACNVPILASETGSFHAMSGPQPFGYVVPLDSNVEAYQKAMYDILMGDGFAPRSYVERYYSFDLFENRYRKLVRSLTKST
jgi:glycosyltransferase involved in cell wall biosynthesis